MSRVYLAVGSVVEGLDDGRHGLAFFGECYRHDNFIR